MLDSEEKGFNSDTLTRRSFRLSKWKKTFTPNIDLTDNHLINHNLINHNLSRISGDSKEESSSTIIKSESIESDLDDIRPLHSNKEKMESFKNAFKPQCPDFDAQSDCPFSCCVFLCLLVRQRRSKRKNSQHGQKDKKNHSSNSIQSNGNTSTIQEDDFLYKSTNASNLPTRVSSQTNLNNQRGSNDNLPEQVIDQQPGTAV